MQKLENWSIHTTSDGQEKVLIAEVTARHNIDGSALNTGWPTQTTTAQDAEQIAAFHPGFAWHGSHEQCPIGAAETLIQIGSGHHFIEEREGAVIEFHDHSTQSGQCWLNFDEAEVDGLIRAEDGTGGDTEQQRVANLTSSTSDRNGNGILHK